MRHRNTKIAFVAAMVAMLAIGCVSQVDVAQGRQRVETPDTLQMTHTRDRASGIDRFVDHENNVVCYEGRSNGAWSCVQPR